MEQKLTLSMIWTVRCLVLHLSVRPLALLNVSSLVVDADLADNDLLICQQALKHFGTDSKTILENNIFLPKEKN